MGSVVAIEEDGLSWDSLYDVPMKVLKGVGIWIYPTFADIERKGGSGEEAKAKKYIKMWTSFMDTS